MDKTTLIQLINDAVNSNNQDKLASLILEFKPTDQDVIVLLIKKFNIGVQNVEKHLEAAEYLNVHSDKAYDLNTVTRAALLSNSIKDVKEKPKDEDSDFSLGRV